MNPPPPSPSYQNPPLFVRRLTLQVRTRTLGQHICLSLSIDQKVRSVGHILAAGVSITDLRTSTPQQSAARAAGAIGACIDWRDFTSNDNPTHADIVVGVADLFADTNCFNWVCAAGEFNFAAVTVTALRIDEVALVKLGRDHGGHAASEEGRKS